MNSNIVPLTNLQTMINQSNSSFENSLIKPSEPSSNINFAFDNTDYNENQLQQHGIINKELQNYEQYPSTVIHERTIPNLPRLSSQNYVNSKLLIKKVPVTSL